MTVDEFLGWAEGRDGRWELQDGELIAMSPAVARRQRFVDNCNGAAWVARPGLGLSQRNLQ